MIINILGLRIRSKFENGFSFGNVLVNGIINL